MLCLVGCVSLSYAEAEVPAAFMPPAGYPAQRYEAGWNKNPFTLKTAPVLAQQVSFAKDLAIAAYYGDADDPTVVVVNTKTGERTKIRQDQPAANGMRLKGLKLSSSRNDIAAELTLGNETCEVRFNQEYTKQVASAESVKAPPGAPTHNPASAPKVPVPAPASAMPPGSQPMLPSSQTPAPKINRPVLKPVGAPVAAVNPTAKPASPAMPVGNARPKPGMAPVLSGRRLN